MEIASQRLYLRAGDDVENNKLQGDVPQMNIRAGSSDRDIGQKAIVGVLCIYCLRQHAHLQAQIWRSSRVACTLHEVTKREVQEEGRNDHDLAQLLYESANVGIVQIADYGCKIAHFISGIGETLKPDIQLAEAKSR
jgi:hypothetical protein